MSGENSGGVLNKDFICPECETCNFFVPHPFARKKKDGWWCRALREPSHNEHCGMYIEDDPYHVFGKPEGGPTPYL